MPMVPENPGPPNQPNIFCAPCAKKTTPRTSLMSEVTVLSSVANNLRCISNLLSLADRLCVRRPTVHEMKYPYIRILCVSTKDPRPLARVPSRWHLPFPDQGGMLPMLASPLTFNHIRGRWLWLAECILAE